jgi:DNA replicative helicase MCM subunit Mcm2 (Cdc46/Mcm family)
MKKELQSVKKDLNALAKRVDKLVAGLKKAEAVKPKKKAATKKSVKTAAPKKTVAKKVAPKKAAAKKPTAADTVFKAIAKLKKGSDTAGLVKKTGYDKKKVANIIFKLKKQGKITSPKKGLYVKA